MKDVDSGKGSEGNVDPEDQEEFRGPENPVSVREDTSNSSPKTVSGYDTPSGQPKRAARSGRIWVPVIIAALALVLIFSIVNLVNADATTSLTVLFSTLITTFPLVIIVVLGVYFVFVGGRRRGRSRSSSITKRMLGRVTVDMGISSAQSQPVLTHRKFMECLNPSFSIFRLAYKASEHKRLLSTRISSVHFRPNLDRFPTSYSKLAQLRTPP
ncbi:MAG TPA: hypothetical protein VFF30_02415 [Nitrososphaerales archaeon]|nr:hypothetical protein [Nitrososphaerales archaeon]